MLTDADQAQAYLQCWHASQAVHGRHLHGSRVVAHRQLGQATQGAQELLRFCGICPHNIDHLQGLQALPAEKFVHIA
jgi:hypothetical protein